MKPQIETRKCSTNPLEEILTEEIGVCQRILQATEAATTAIGNGDLEAFQAAVTRRARSIKTLEDLASRAEEGRASSGGHPAKSSQLFCTLQEVTARVQEADAQARQATERAVGDLREQIQGLDIGRNGLRGYRGSRTLIPRFSDRRG